MTYMYLGYMILNNDVLILTKVEKKLSKLLKTHGLPNSLYIYIMITLNFVVCLTRVLNHAHKTSLIHMIFFLKEAKADGKMILMIG